MMNIDDIDVRIAELLKDSRYNAGISQERLAALLGVSKKTVQNLENGFSKPNVNMIIKWFDAIDLPVYPYLLRLNHPELDTLNANSTDEEVRQVLLDLVQEMDISQMRQQFFEMFGEHGTAPDGMGQVKTAYLHLPMYIKISIAETICTQFELCKARNELVKPDHIMPDIPKLKEYIDAAKQAVINGKETYKY